LPADCTTEDGRRTFAVFEVMVREPWRGTEGAARSHELLLRDRPEQRATLLVDASPTTVRRRYEHWGAGPSAISSRSRMPPVYAIMIRNLQAV